MPTISNFFGIRISMFYGEHNPPHFHAQYQDFNAVYGIRDGKRIKGKMPPKLEKIIFDWAKQYRKELLDNWELMKSEGKFNKIRGAE